MEINVAPGSIAHLRLIAASLHENNALATSVEVDSQIISDFARLNSTGVTIDKNVISFESVEIRNQLAAQHYFEQNKELLLENNNWLTVSLNLFRIELQAKDYVSGRLLALLSEGADLLSLAADAITQHNVFDVLTAIGLSLPYMKKLSAVGILKLVVSQERHTRRDHLYGEFFRKLSKTLESHGDVAAELLEHLRTNIDQSNANLYLTAATAVRLSGNACQLAESIMKDEKAENRILVSVAIQMMGNLLCECRLPLEIRQKLADSVRGYFDSDDELLQESSMRAVVNSAGCTSEFADDIERLIEQGNPNASCAFAMILSNSAQPKERIRKLLPALARNYAVNKLNTTLLDDSIANLIDDAEVQPQAIESLEQWVVSIKQLSSIPSSFPCTTARILQNKRLFCALIRKWLLHSSFSLRSAVDDIMSQQSEDPPTLLFEPSEIEALDLTDFELLARRCIGFLTVGFTTVTLIVSLLRSKDIDTERILIVRDLLEELGQNYPGFVISELEELVANTAEAEVKQAFEALVARLKEEHDARRKLPIRKELQPTSLLINAFAELQQRNFNRAFKRSESKSVLRKLVTQVPINAGARVIYYGKSLQDSRLGSSLNEIQVDITVPRLLHIDPVGYDLDRLTYRLLERRNQ